MELQSSNQSLRPRHYLWGLAGSSLVLILLLRIVTLAHLPILDPSESRYAVIGAIMANDGDFITPKVYQDGKIVPFFSKPPLHFWLEAGCVKLFGNNELAFRLPSFLSAMWMLLLTAAIGMRVLKRERVIVSMIVLLTNYLFFFLAGVVLVDMTLSAAITGVMTSFYLGCHKRDRLWGYLLFVFLGIGFLTKGPIAAVFPGFAITLWLSMTRNWAELKNLPWLRGSAIFLALTVPVFLLEEYSNPGFLKYFFLNENLLRYLVKDYGDRFGSGHRYPYGSSWFFLLAGFLPWSLLLVPLLISARKRGRLSDPTLLYFLCWGVAPAVVLTFARQLLGTYLLPGFGGLALFIGATYPAVCSGAVAAKLRKGFASVCVVITLLSGVVASWSVLSGFSIEHGVMSIFSLLLLMIGTCWIAMENNSYRLVVCFGALFAVASASQTLNGCVYSKQFVSSANLLDEIESRYLSNHPTLYFPFGVPLSAYLYSDQPVVDGGDTFQLPVKDDNSLIVIRDKQTDEFQIRFGTDFKELLRVGKWKVLHKEQHEGSCHTAMMQSHSSCTIHSRLTILKGSA